jgi:hypothetical protein
LTFCRDQKCDGTEEQESGELTVEFTPLTVVVKNKGESRTWSAEAEDSLVKCEHSGMEDEKFDIELHDEYWNWKRRNSLRMIGCDIVARQCMPIAECDAGVSRGFEDCIRGSVACGRCSKDDGPESGETE